MTTEIFVHAPIPPFQRIAGPIPFAGLSRQLGLSLDSTADFSIAATSSIDQSWLRPGICWCIEQTGEEIWAGFIESQPIVFQASSIDISLVGPKRGLLSIELAVRLPVPASRGFAVQQALLAAQSQNIGIYPGHIDHEGAAVPLEVRGETISDFIEAVKEVAAGADWRERTYLENNTLKFSLDFGLLQRPTNITIGAEAIIEGSLIRQPVVASVTVLGQAIGFEQRSSVSTAGQRSQVAMEPTDATLHPLMALAVERLTARNIGPGAVRHVIEISERFDEDLNQHAIERHLELLRAGEEITLVLDSRRAIVQRIELGDIIRLTVPDWAIGIAVDENIHIREIRPDEPAGRREIIANVI